MTVRTLRAEQRHLGELLEAIQRCVFFLDASIEKVPWPLTRVHLENNKKDVSLFETLSSINERFSNTHTIQTPPASPVPNVAGYGFTGQAMAGRFELKQTDPPHFFQSASG